MDDLIEKVKQGIKVCTDSSSAGDCVICEMHCPYEEDHVISCYTIMCRDALSVIESLQAENKILSENCDGLAKQRDDFAQTINEQKMEIERLQPKKGHWEMKEDPLGFWDKIPVCSECGCMNTLRKKTAFCEHCGADMKEGDGDG